MKNKAKLAEVANKVEDLIREVSLLAKQGGVTLESDGNYYGKADAIWLIRVKQQLEGILDVFDRRISMSR